MIPLPHEWNSSRTASISQLIPIADILGLQRMSSLNFPDQLKIREPGKNLPSLPRSSTALLMRRKTSDNRALGNFVEGRSSFDQEANLDEHLRKIEVACATRRQSNQNLKSDRPLQHRPSIQSLGQCSTECLCAVLTCRSVGLQFRVIAAFIIKPLPRANILCTTNSQSTVTVPCNRKPPCIASVVLELEEARYNYRPWTKLRRGLHRFEWTPSQDTEDKSPFCIARQHLEPKRSACHSACARKREGRGKEKVLL
jgi:hypothetical protein